jgi:uncharacterized protein (TIGR00255 family)
MLRSMTGYGTSHAESAQFSVTVSVKSTNHRFLDAQLRFPSSLDFFDSRARTLLKSRVQRGHVEVTVNLERIRDTEIRVDRPLLSAYVRACEEVRREFQLASEPDLAVLLRMPGVVAGSGEIAAPAREALQRALEISLVEALDRLNEMREREGAAIECDLESRFRKLESLCSNIDELSRNLGSDFRARLERRLRELTKGEEVEPARIAQEVALLAVRSDITEEVTRLKSHLVQAKHLLKEGTEAGKKLDFLLQELNREANTILSKTADVPGCGSAIVSSAIEMKAEIEKLREQAQNLE